MKIFAYFLPQFHEIQENNEWWGKGFTEWTNVKAGKPLFQGHHQPKHPLNNNYYNLLDKSTMEWQTEIMHKYKVDGMIYYHYYFKGRKLLEKPAENLLKWTDIKQPFFFCWANHDWNKSWQGSRELLLKQEYGTQADWEAHFQYLLPFFRDKRYEKKDNMPLLMIFKSDFPEKNEMFRYFDQRCKNYGFEGLYLIETYGGNCGGKTIREDIDNFWKKCSSVTKDIHLREPSVCHLVYRYSKKNIDLIPRCYRKIRSVLGWKLNHPYLYRYNGEKLYQYMINVGAKCPGIHGLFFEWDNTPRHNYRGYVITPVSRESIFRYLEAINDEEYLFVNAWNEWAEGMILEPTEENGYRYLEMIRDWKKSKEQ